MSRKIIIVSPAYPYRGGQALVEAYLHHFLSGSGFDVSTVSFTKLYPSIFFPGTTQFESSSFVAFPHPDKIKRIISSINPWTWIKAARYIARKKPDAVVFVWWMPFFAPAYKSILLLLRLMIKTKIIFLVENFISHEQRWFDSMMARLALRSADAFICQSGFVRLQLESAFPQKPLIQTTLSIYDCYDLKKYDQAKARDFLQIKSAPVILFFGLIRPYKGLDKLLESMPEVLRTYPGATLLIAGENYESFEKYERIIADLKLNENVSLHIKYIPNELVEPYFKAADVVVMPYYSATQSGIVMMAYGFRKPVVVTDTGGLKELVREGITGSVVSSNNPAQLAEGIKKILALKPSVDFEKNISSMIYDFGYKNLEGFFRQILA